MDNKNGIEVQFRLSLPAGVTARRLARWLLPTPGNALFTMLVIGVVIWAQMAGAAPWARPVTQSVGASATTVNYQGKLADNDGAPLDGTYSMSFALYDAATAGEVVWGPEVHGAVAVSGGLFSVGLGSQTSGGIPTTTWNGDRYLEIAVNGETLAPRELIRSVPIAGMALTVPDGSITTDKLVRGEQSYWADYRSYIRFLKEGGVDGAALCPEGGTPVGVTGPTQSLNLHTGNDIAEARWNGSGSCINVHKMAPCGSIIGNHYPYTAEPCTTDFSGKWAPFYWWDGDTSDEVTYNILGSGIGCYPVYYACVQ